MSSTSSKSDSKRSINTETILSQDEHPTNTPCDISCLNGGSCTFIEYFDYPIAGQNGYYMACQCPSSYRGGQCEILNSNSNKGKMTAVGVVISLTLVLLIGMAYRRRRQGNAARGNRFHSVYMDNLARDLGNLARENGSDDEDDGNLEEVEFDRRDTRESLEEVEDGALVLSVCEI
ncbi:hypothetical protein ACHAWO_010293 [Cyclotella atomus]|uniref:EGF-like domain-containing protein n=1 Tax=Cyclotella atomus TaxID=382360 RepID=A0ABD3Q591_9STRA